MKALIVSDEINHFHWAMLKSVLLILSLLPLSHFFLNLWQNTDGSSQIMVGFFAMSLFSASTLVSFLSALHATIKQLHAQNYSLFEQQLFNVYRYVPMVFLTGMLSYLALQW